MAGGPRHVVVGRLRKPHGLKGDIVLFPLTDDPERTFRPGAALWVLDLAGEVVTGPLEVERARAYHREWLVKFRGVESRSALDAVADLRDRFLAVPAESLVPPAEGEAWVHELAGFAVRDGTGRVLGVVSDVYELPGGLAIEVQGAGREFILPWRPEFVQQLRRDERVVVVTVPDGLLDG